MKTKTQHNLISGTSDLNVIESIKDGESMDWTIVHNYEPDTEKENIKLICKNGEYTVKVECFGLNEHTPYFTGIEIYDHIYVTIGALRMLLWI